MTLPDPELHGRAGDLRRAFDAAFAAPPPAPATPTVDLLAIQVGGSPYAIRLAEVAGLFAGRKVSPLPGAVHGLLGIAGLRGSLLPVYDLGVLLGQAPCTAPRWLAVAGKKPVAVAFEAVDGHFRLGRDAIAEEASAEGHRHVREIARGPVPRPVVRLASVLEDIERRAREHHPREER